MNRILALQVSLAIIAVVIISHLLISEETDPWKSSSLGSQSPTDNVLQYKYKYKYARDNTAYASPSDVPAAMHQRTLVHYMIAGRS